VPAADLAQLALRSGEGEGTFRASWLGAGAELLRSGPGRLSGCTGT
jgi:hypothetical protein